MANLHQGQEKIQKEQHSLKQSQFGLKERVDLSCKRMNLVNENILTIGENQMQTLWEIVDSWVLQSPSIISW
nr:glutamic acid-rich protein-like [Ipomoea batatas]